MNLTLSSLPSTVKRIVRLSEFVLPHLYNTILIKFIQIRIITMGILVGKVAKGCI